VRTATELARALDAALWAEAVAGFGLDPWQADVLRTDARGVLMNCSRQTGKSTVAALLALHDALYVPGTLALLLSPSLRQSSELFKKVADFYGALADPVPADAESALRIELANGSRIVSLPGKEATVRGYSGVDLLIVDEAARVVDDLYCAVRPMLAVSGGRLVALSTPFGKRGWWFKEWSEGGDGWKRVKVTAEQCPRISDEFLAEERRALGDWWYRQEYLCEFMDAQASAFTWEMIESTRGEEVQLWDL
jgi:hypothetical protein